MRAVFAGGDRPLSSQLPTLQDPTQSFLSVRSCGNFSGLSVTPWIPGLCSSQGRMESPPDARIGSRLVPAWCRCQVAGHPPGFGTWRRPHCRRLLEAAAGWPRRSGQRNGPCSVSPAAHARSRRLCPAVGGSRPLRARSPSCHRGVAGRRNRPAAVVAQREPFQHPFTRRPSRRRSSDWWKQRRESTRPGL